MPRGFLGLFSLGMWVLNGEDIPAKSGNEENSMLKETKDGGIGALTLMAARLTWMLLRRPSTPKAHIAPRTRKWSIMNIDQGKKKGRKR